MASLKLSRAARNWLANIAPLAKCFRHGVLLIYSGSAPTNPEDAATGTLLVTITDTAGAHTDEVCMAGSVTITGTGTITNVTIGGQSLLDGQTVPFNSTNAQTANDLADAINRAQNDPKYRASVTGGAAKVVITALPGAGTVATGAITVTGGTTTTVNMNTEVAGVAPVNGLKFGNSSSGIVAKLSTQTWSGLAVAAGTPGYFRLRAAVVDAQAIDTIDAFPRIQGDVSSAGATMNLLPDSVTIGVGVPVNTFGLTLPVGT